jgi:anti-sigma factor RsiW
VSAKSFSQSSDEMIKLMAYADGELEGSERDEVEKLLEKDADAQAFVRQLGGLGVHIRVAHRNRAKNYPRIDLGDAIMAKVESITPDPKEENAQKSEKAVAKVSSLDAARAKRASRMKAGAIVAAALALAASIFVMTRQPSEAPMAQSPKTLTPAQNTPVAAHAAIEVNAVESSGQSVSVFYLPSTKDELSTDVVVWVEESGENK